MSYKTIVVHVDDSRCSDARVEFAVDFALKHDARLIGLSVVCQDFLRPLFFDTGVSLNLAGNEAQHGRHSPATTLLLQRSARLSARSGVHRPALR